MNKIKPKKWEEFVVKSYKGLMGFFVFLALVILVLAIIYYPRYLPLWEFEPGDVVMVLLGLFVVALFIERGVEVLMLIFRDSDEKWLKAEADKEKAKYEQASEKERAKLLIPMMEAEATYNFHKSVTKQLAMYITFLIGIVVAFAGIRSLQPLVDMMAFVNLRYGQRLLFLIVDIIITGALLGGGSKGIHEIVEAVLNTVEWYRSFVKTKKSKAEEKKG